MITTPCNHILHDLINNLFSRNNYETKGKKKRWKWAARPHLRSNHVTGITTPVCAFGRRLGRSRNQPAARPPARPPKCDAWISLAAKRRPREKGLTKTAANARCDSKNHEHSDTHPAVHSVIRKFPPRTFNRTPFHPTFPSSEPHLLLRAFPPMHLSPSASQGESSQLDFYLQLPNGK